MTKLIALFVRAFPLRFALSAVLGLLAGFSSAGLLAAIHRGLQEPGPSRLLLLFAAAAAANVVATVLSNVQLLTLTNTVLAEHRITLARSILGAPYAKIESLGAAHLLGALTEDIQSIGNAANAMVAVIVASAVILGSLGY